MDRGFKFLSDLGKHKFNAHCLEAANGPISIQTKHTEFAKDDLPHMNVSQISNESDRPNE